MAAIRLKQKLFSLRTTAFLLCLFILFMVLNVVIPQERVVGKAAMEEALASGAVQRFLLKDLGLSHLPTSVPFLVVLGVLYLQLIVLLWKLGGSTLRRVRIAPAHWDTWKTVDIRPSSARDAVKTAASEGFRLKHLDKSTWWGVRNRYSPVGFLVLHGSFLLLLTGGLFVYYTRFVGRMTLVTGDTQLFSSRGPAGIIRTPLYMPDAGEPFSIQIVKTEAIKEQGEPVALQASMRFFGTHGSAEGEASVNHPAGFMGYQFMPNSSDLAMTFRLYDRQGYLLDTVVALSGCQAGEKTTVPLGDACNMDIDCEGNARGILICNGQRGTMSLEVNESITTDSYYLTLVSVAPWVSFLVVRERGGGFLVAGFILAVIGLVMRFIFPRQDLIIAPGRIYYKGEFFPLYLGDYLRKMEEENIVTN